MTNPMLAELDEVVRLAEKATPGAWMSHTTNITQVGIDLKDPLNAHGLAVASGHPEEAKANAAAIAAAVNFLRTHHATLADMAKRLEMEAGFLKVAETTLYQIATTPRNAGARRNASATMRFIETQRAAAIDATQEGEG